MNLLPYERLRITTMLSSKEACEKLVGVVELSPHAVWFKSNHKPYQGSIDDTQFEVAPVVHYTSPSVPIIKGKIQSETSGCSIQITMHPTGIFVAPVILMLGVSGYLLLSALSSFISSALQGTMNDPSSLMGPGIAFTIIYAFFLVPFKFESMASKEFFRELFQAEEIEELGMSHPFRAAG